MAVQVDEGGGRMLRQKIEALGVTAHTGKNTVEIIDGEEARIAWCLPTAPISTPT